MSSKPRPRIEDLVLLVASGLLLLWYAYPQLAYSLKFGYEIALFLFPNWVPNLLGH